MLIFILFSQRILGLWDLGTWEDNNAYFSQSDY